MIVHQVGYLYEVTKDSLVLTQAVGAHIVAAREEIPKGMIKQVFELDSEGVPTPIPRRTRKKKAT